MIETEPNKRTLFASPADQGEHNAVGRPVAFVDAVEKVMGKADYVDDLSLPRMLYGKILRSPLAHARIKRIDTTRAARLPGVKAVITHLDASDHKLGPDIQDANVLAVDRVRYVGDEVAAVAAVSAEVAREALDLIAVEYEPLPVVADMTAALAEGAPLLHLDRPGNIARRYRIDRGDVDADFSCADEILEDEFETSLVQACYMEPMGCIAEWDARGRLTIWTSIQSAFQARRMIAWALDIPESAVVVKVPYIGGGFGGKTWIRNLHPITALLAKKAGRPVKVTLTRSEEFLTMHPRVPARIHLRIAAKRDGTLLAKEAQITADSGAYAWGGPKVMLNMSVRADCLYRWRAVRTEAALVYTNHVPTSGYRGFGNAQMHFALESMIDEMCRKAGWDPVQMRLKNIVRQGDRTIHGWNLRSCGLGECIERSWAAIQQGRQPVTEDGGRIRRGVGLACATHVSGNRSGNSFDGSSALLRLTEDGRVLVFSGESDMGQGARTAFAQIVAEVLGIPLSAVEVVPLLDTDTSPYCFGSYSSRVTTLAGNAIYLAACKLREQVVELAGKRLGCAASEIHIEDGIARAANKDKRASLAEIAQLGLRSRGATGMEAFVCYDPPTEGTDASFYGDYSAAYNYGAHAVEVEVDTETGVVRVLRLVAAHDVGYAINPAGVEGQILGGVAQGLGWALTENLELQDGVIRNPSLAGYVIPTTLDMPQVVPILVETHDPIGPFGAKGVGEPALIPTAPAIANAIDNAVGVRIRTLPISPEKVLLGICRDAFDRKEKGRGLVLTQ